MRYTLNYSGTRFLSTDYSDSWWIPSWHLKIHKFTVLFDRSIVRSKARRTTTERKSPTENTSLSCAFVEKSLAGGLSKFVRGRARGTQIRCSVSSSATKHCFVCGIVKNKWIVYSLVMNLLHINETFPFFSFLWLFKEFTLPSLPSAASRKSWHALSEHKTVTHLRFLAHSFLAALCLCAA